MALFKRNKGQTDSTDVKAPGSVVAPEDTVVPTDVLPNADEVYPAGGVKHNTNDSLDRLKESEDESNNPLVTGKDSSDKSLQRKKGESQQKYNERVPVAIQPVQPGPTHNYLGQPLN